MNAEEARELRHELRTPVNHLIGYAELLMWLLGSTTKEQKQVIQAYFKGPAAALVGEGGGMGQRGQGQTGPRGANSGLIDWNNVLSQPEPTEEQPPTQQALEKASDEAVAKEAAEREQKSLD